MRDLEKLKADKENLMRKIQNAKGALIDAKAEREEHKAKLLKFQRISEQNEKKAMSIQDELDEAKANAEKSRKKLLDKIAKLEKRNEEEEEKKTKLMMLARKIKDDNAEMQERLVELEDIEFRGRENERLVLQLKNENARLRQQVGLT